MRILAGVVLWTASCASPATVPSNASDPSGERPRWRDLGVDAGALPPGPLNAITDVPGVTVGHVTLVQGDAVRTGVTAILPHGSNLFRDKVPAAVHVANGFGKLVGSTQVDELGRIETPILLTNTLSVWVVAEGIVDHMLLLPGNESIRSVNPVVGETNDGFLNDIRGRHVRREHAVEAIRNARGGAVEEGAVGAGTGTICFGWKGGIGTSSRKVERHVLGVLVQTNYGGRLEMAGVPVGKELGPPPPSPGDGSCMIVVATDAPLDARQLKRLAARAPLALGRTGSVLAHGSGDYVIAFSTAREARPMADEALNPLFQAVVEATEEAIYNSLLKAQTTTGFKGRRIEALPVERLKEILRKFGRSR